MNKKSGLSMARFYHPLITYSNENYKLSQKLSEKAHKNLLSIKRENVYEKKRKAYRDSWFSP